MGHFLKELKRRNVFRVGAAYVVVSWLIVQVIETVSGPLGLPAWTEAFFIVLVLAGLPLILLFAWAFELTPEGLRKTREVDRDASVTADTGKKLNYAIIAALVIALGYFVWERQGLIEKPADQPVLQSGVHGDVDGAHAASVAVLPFVNMSADPEQEYFSDGMSEELLNLLAKIPELRVPARTSSFQFKGQNLNIADVAKQLNVAHVLEGSVRKADVRIRVTAQLIEAETGYHLWSETYDRELTDIFEIQDEISAAIVEALSETLGISPEAAPHVTAAASPAAYNAYLLGQHLIRQRTKGDIEASVVNFEEAIRLDPNYAPAYAGLGLAWRLLQSDRQSYGNLTLEEMLAKAVPPLEKALEIDPMQPDALGAMGLVRESEMRFNEAVEYYQRALSVNPSQTDIRNWYAAALEELGRPQEAFAEQEKAYELDPLSVLNLNNYTNALVMRRQFDRADGVLERFEQIDQGRAANFRSMILDEQHRAADSAVEIFRGADSAPENLRVRGAASFSLLQFGMYDEALAVWPYPNTYPVVSNSSDAEHALELARRQLEADPTDMENVQELAFSYWRADDTEQAMRHARRYLNSLDDSVRATSNINWLLGIVAWQQGDQETMRAHVEPLLAQINSNVEAGIDFTFTRFALSVAHYLLGDRELSLENLEAALNRGKLNPSLTSNLYRQLDWSNDPDVLERRQRYDAYVDEERRKFLQVACGPDGFTSWQPSPDTCAEIESI